MPTVFEGAVWKMGKSLSVMVFVYKKQTAVEKNRCL